MPRCRLCGRWLFLLLIRKLLTGIGGAGSTSVLGSILFRKGRILSLDRGGPNDGFRRNSHNYRVANSLQILSTTTRSGLVTGVAGCSADTGWDLVRRAAQTQDRSQRAKREYAVGESDGSQCCHDRAICSGTILCAAVDYAQWQRRHPDR